MAESKGKGKGKKAPAKGKKAPAKGKGKSKEQAAKKPAKKEAGPPKVIQVDHKRREKMLAREYNPMTGSRFRHGVPILSQQLAFEISHEMVKSGENVKAIRAKLADTRTANGAPRDLDSGYWNLVAACHPEIFEVWSDGTVKLLQKNLEIDKKARNARTKELEERQERRKDGVKKTKSKSKAKAKAPAKGKKAPAKGGKKGGKRPALNKK